jgi:hypothetical protein
MYLPEFDKAKGDAAKSLDIELRGYEVARWTPTGWDVVSKWRPNDHALNEALKACAFLNERQPHNTYAVRAIVSMLPPQPQLATQEEVEFAEAVKAAAPAEHQEPAGG